MRVFACMASSLDGKIGPANTERFVSITSRHDLDHLIALRDEADGILFGAATFRAWPKVHQGLKNDKPAHHFIMSQSLQLDPATPLFQDSTTPLTIFTSNGTALVSTALPEHIEVVLCPEGDRQIPFILDHIKNLGLNSLLIEGGGHILQLFIEAQALQELYLTLAPMLITQTEAPNLFGALELSTPLEVELLENKAVDNEIYLHYSFRYPKDPREK